VVHQVTTFRKEGVAAEILPLAAGTDVDCGSLADGQHSYETFGGKLRLVTASGRDLPWASSSLAAYIVVRKGLAALAFLWWMVVWGTQWGQMDGLGPRTPSQPFEGVPLMAGLPSGAPSTNCPGPWAVLSSGDPALQLVNPWRTDSYLVDSASSHMLVSKIKPCMSKYKQLYCETANGSLNQLSFI
jgi:hypothetical protein